MANQPYQTQKIPRACFLNSGPESLARATSPAGVPCPPAGEVAKPSTHREDSLFQLLSREDRLLMTLQEAQEWMEVRGEGQYGEEEAMALERLCVDKVRDYLGTRPTTRDAC